MAKKLLLIEYEPRYVDKVRSSAGDDFEVTVAKDGPEGLVLYDTVRPDVVLVSAALPGSRPNEVIREIRRKGGVTAPPVLLMMSGYKGSNPKADAQKIGAFDILEKPFSEDTFRSLVFDAVQSTDPGAETVRLDRAGTLTSSDIFSDVLDDLQPEAPAETPAARPTTPMADLESMFAAPPASSAPPPRTASAGGDVSKRLEETLSGVLSGKKPGGGATSPPRSSRPAAGRDVDSMLSQTLSGLEIGTSRSKAPARPVATPPAETSTASASAAPAPPDAGKGRFGQFELIEKIATGGMAEVYKARMSGVDGFQKIVAIKKILPHMAAADDFLAMFADEAKLAAQLNHPNIIHIYDLGKADNSYYIAMEYVDGRDLKSILKAGREHGLPLPPELALFIASKLASALDYAHRRKDFEGRELSLVHRDVSPQNVLISFEGDIKLCDFGIAKAATKSSQTQAGALKGKLQYMSPEQASGRPIDLRSDLFSLGSVLYEMLTGEKLFSGDSDLNLLEKVRVAKVAPPSEKNSDVPKRADAITLKLLAKAPDERYQNASDVQRDLESVLYTYSPAPGSADVAIYLHHLQAEEKASSMDSDRALDAAFAPSAAEPAAPVRRKKAKGTVVQRKTTGNLVRPAPSPAEPAAEPAGAAVDTKSGVFGAYSSSRVAAEKKSRSRLYVAIGVAAAVLVAVGFVILRRGKGAAPAMPVPNETTAPAATTAVAPSPATPSASSTTLTEKAVEDEVRRQLAEKQKELQKSQSGALGKVEAPPAATPPIERKPLVVPAPAPMPLAVAPAQPSAPAPMKVPSRIEPEAAPSRPAPSAEPALSRGQLVGPGPGVVEPEIESRLNVQYPLAARQERVTGTVIIFALVDENGRVQSARIQRGVPSKTGVNEAIRDAVLRARFHPATKNGVPVKMYKTLSVDVNP